MIAIPSYKRAKNCETAQWLDETVIFCHQFEVEEYKKYNDNSIIAIPDDLAGKGMGVIRNFILDHSDSEVLMLDDDISKFGYFEKTEEVIMTPREVYDFAAVAFRMCREAKTILWGLNVQSDKKFYREYSPFSLSSIVLGPCFGVINDNDIRFDEKLGLKEDYDFAVQVLRKYRKVLRFNKYHYFASHIGRKGGCAAHRTSQKEIDNVNLFQQKWGSKIVKIQRKTQGGNVSINPVVICPIGGI